MKLAVVLLCLMPLVFSARVNERLIFGTLLGKYDIIGLAEQLVSQFGTDETEQQCETQLCPPLLDAIDGHNALITHLVCAAVCREAQVLAGQLQPTPGK